MIEDFTKYIPSNMPVITDGFGSTFKNVIKGNFSTYAMISEYLIIKNIPDSPCSEKYFYFRVSVIDGNISINQYGSIWGMIGVEYCPLSNHTYDKFAEVLSEDHGHMVNTHEFINSLSLAIIDEKNNIEQHSIDMLIDSFVTHLNS